MVSLMKHIILPLLATVSLLAGAAQAEAGCVAEFKAKRDNPFALYYDTAQISGPCTVQNARAQLARMLAGRGLVLLKVLSVTET